MTHSFTAPVASIMRKICRTFLPFVGLVLTTVACGQRHSGASPGDTLTEGRAIPMRHAHWLSMTDCDSFTLVRLLNPWDTTVTLHTYLLVDSKRSLPSPMPQGTVVRTPVRRAVVFSAVHYALLSELGAANGVSGVCDADYMPAEVRHEVNNGTLIDFGRSMNPDVERIIDARPDALMPSPFENSGGYGQLEKLQIPIIECADYMETSPLGRAEWMRLYGRLFGRAEQADSLFDQVERHYNELCRMASTNTEKPPTVVSDLVTGGTWYVPGNRSTVSHLYTDAGACTATQGGNGSGSLALSPETVVEQAAEADFWIVKYNRPTDLTRAGLQTEHPFYTRFKAFSQGRIYGCNSARIPFYEETPFHPDRLLADFVAIFHPEALPGHTPRYFSPLP
ncbi:MAG: ABC transporter substrate-binding protein [Clostridium sp.]|nr:ABC transporter substrate-binding protein [Clostridium sp.]